jgi:hypothetical protein
LSDVGCCCCRPVDCCLPAACCLAAAACCCYAACCVLLLAAAAAAASAAVRAPAPASASASASLVRTVPRQPPRRRPRPSELLRRGPAMQTSPFLLMLLLATPVAAAPVTTWHVVWTGGQSNSVGTNSQKSGYPEWPTTDRIQMFCWSGRGCKQGSFAPAKVPLWGEFNVGFSQTFANLLLATLPADHGIITLNTGVGGTGFVDGRWVVPNGTLTKQSVSAVQKMAAAQPQALGGKYVFHAMLWHQGEDDAGDNRRHFQSSYCNYLQNDMAALVDFLRKSFPGASAGTPFLDGGMLPYWVDAVNGTEPVMAAIYALNTSRPCTGTADSRIFSDFIPGTKTPNGEPGHRSGVTGDVIHFNATQATVMGHQYWAAYQRAVMLTSVVPSSKTSACKKMDTKLRARGLLAEAVADDEALVTRCTK